jgi:hypothetical protein
MLRVLGLVLGAGMLVACTAAPAIAPVSRSTEQNPRVRSVDLSSLLDPSFIQSAADRGLDPSS